jgi:hypothetical protein
MKRNILASLLLLAGIAVSAPSKAQCGSDNTAFQSGEMLTYDLYFNWKFVWFKVGTASMNTTRTSFRGQSAYRSYLITRTSAKADKYFTMRDTLISYTDLNLVPLYYQKRAFEGKSLRCEDVWYSYPNGQCSLKMKYSRNNGEPELRSHESKYCAYDMISMMMRARSFDASQFKVGQRINFLMAEGRRCEWRQLIYHGKKRLKMKDGNSVYNTLVFSYVEKEDGKEREIVRFYVTDDKNHLPVCLDLNLNFGSAKAYLRGAKGMRNSVEARVK